MQHLTVVQLFFDEAHMALTEDNYCDCLQNIYEIRSLPMQPVPPPSEESLKKAFGLTSNAITICQQTNQPEPQYLWQPVCKSNAQLCSTVYHIIQQYAKEFKPEDRTLVFVPYLKTGDELAKFLGCKFYKGKDMEKDERSQVYLNWRLGVDKTMICTSRFGAGNDYPSVHLIIHAGTPLEMIGYIQESSHGAADLLLYCATKPKNLYFPLTRLIIKVKKQHGKPLFTLHCAFNKSSQSSMMAYQLCVLISQMLYNVDNAKRTRTSNYQEKNTIIFPPPKPSLNHHLSKKQEQ